GHPAQSETDQPPPPHRLPKRALTLNSEEALRLAREEAARNSAAQISSDHVLLAMTHLFHSTASRVLQGSGIGLETLREKLTNQASQTRASKTGGISDRHLVP